VLTSINGSAIGLHSPSLAPRAVQLVQGLSGDESQSSFERSPPRPFRSTFIPKIQVTSSPVPGPSNAKTSGDGDTDQENLDPKVLDNSKLMELPDSSNPGIALIPSGRELVRSTW
jgi:hypothetical protein